MKNIKVSIVCIAYNQEKYIAQALEGFVSQKANFIFEAIIADDSSSDDTPKIIKEYAAKYPNIIKPVLRKNNIGVQNNLIDALKRATGDYIALCEGDDFWTDSLKLQKQVNFLDANREFALVFHPVRVIFENHEEEDAVFPETTDSKQFTLKNLLEDNYIQTNSVMYRKINYDHLSTEVMPFDWYLHLSHAKNGKVGFINEVMSAYRRHDAGLWWEMYSNPLAAWKKYGKSYLLLSHELMIYYGEKLEYRDIIRKHIARVYEAFASGAPTDGVYDRLAIESVVLAPSETWGYIKGLVEDKKKLIVLGEQINEQLEKQLEQLKEKAAILQETTQRVKELDDELGSIKSSKMWRYTVKYRELKRRFKRPFSA